MRTILFGLILATAGASPARADGGYRMPVAPGPAVESLPPGLWFRGNRYEDFALPDEPAQGPRFAAIAGAFGSDAGATRAARRLDRRRLGLGYPWVVANHDLRLAGRCRDAAVVVAGLFASERDARAWQAADGARRSLRIVPIETAESERPCPWRYDQAGNEVDAAGARLDVVQIDPAADAPAFTPAELDRLEQEQAARSVRSEERERRIARLPASCTVARGSVHVFRQHDAMFRFGWRFAPVRCAGRVAYVPVERTLRSIVIERRPNGESRLHQITDVTCDSANFDVWRYTLEGRVVIPEEPPLFAAGCGGRS